MDLSRHGLYAITDASLIAPGTLNDVVAKAIQGGAAVIQYRDKGRDYARRLAEAQALQALCAENAVCFLINDDVDLALEVGADGVHVGTEDTGLAKARRYLGATAIIGVSCYNRLELALQAQKDGVDYVAFGRFFPSQTKPGNILASEDLLREARVKLTVPIVAIGGITPENGAVLLAAGADLLAVIHGVFGDADPEAAARRYLGLFKNIN
jgi:thiamine-phosphate pyrophosphorylase